MFPIYCTLNRKKISEGGRLGALVFKELAECLVLQGDILPPERGQVSSIQPSARPR